MSPRTETPIAEVRGAVRKLALASDKPVLPNYAFATKVAEDLGVSTRDDDPIARRRWSAFTGQVKRSLAKLAEEGELVKATGLYGIVYRTPEQHQEYLASTASTEAARQARRAERERVYDELMLHGIPVESERGHEIRLSFDAWCTITNALDAMVAGRSAE